MRTSVPDSASFPVHMGPPSSKTTTIAGLLRKKKAWEIFDRLDVRNRNQLNYGSPQKKNHMLTTHCLENVGKTLVLCQRLILGFVIHAQAGIHGACVDSRLRGNDTQPLF